MNQLTFLNDFQRGRRFPLHSELNWLFDWLKLNTKPNMKVLEFGGGVTTWTITNAISNWESYCCMETFLPILEKVQKYIKNVNVISTNWNDIPKINYDLVFVDSSSGPPKGLKPIGNKKKIFRDDAVNWTLPFVNPKCIYILHDWSYKCQWLLARKLLEEKGFQLIASHKNRFGFGIYQKI